MAEVLPYIKRAKIFLIVDHPGMERGLVSLIDGEGDLVVCGVSNHNRNGVLRHMELLRPDLAVAELRLDGRERIELIRMIKRRFPRLPLLAVTVYGESIYNREILDAGADAHVFNPERQGELLRCIRLLLKDPALQN